MARVTLQTLFQDALPAYAQPHPLPAHVRRAARAILQCRTATLGGHVPACPDGHGSRSWDNACRHRSCPQCAYLQTARWRAVQRTRLLAGDHDHGMVTLPPDLNPRWLAHVAVRTTRLFQAVRATWVELWAAPKSLGAQPGMIAARHTGSPTLVRQPHVPCLVTGGGLPPDGSWQAGRHGWLLPVRGGRAVWRGTLLAASRQAGAGEGLGVPEGAGRRRASTS